LLGPARPLGAKVPPPGSRLGLRSTSGYTSTVGAVLARPGTPDRTAKRTTRRWSCRIDRQHRAETVRLGPLPRPAAGVYLDPDATTPRGLVPSRPGRRRTDRHYRRLKEPTPRRPGTAERPSYPGRPAQPSAEFGTPHGGHPRSPVGTTALQAANQQHLGADHSPPGMVATGRRADARLLQPDSASAHAHAGATPRRPRHTHRTRHRCRHFGRRRACHMTA
jgi:hypothetical protein